MAAKYAVKKKSTHARKIVTVLLVVVCLVAFAFALSPAVTRQTPEVVTLTAQPASMRQEQPMPVFQAKAAVDKEGAMRILDWNSSYTVQNLIDDLNRGLNYTITSDTNGMTEGKYRIQITLSKELKEKLENQWSGKVIVNVVDGVLTVKNKHGDWEGEKFKKADGAYISNDWLDLDGKKYYFDAEGKRVSGWQKINSGRYYFDIDGLLQTGWTKWEGATYYLGETGAATVGWLELSGERYYFDQDGKMVTGIVQMGNKKYTFQEDGKLLAEETITTYTGKLIALTFDDGPGNRTMELLNQLERYNAHATFFMVGSRVHSYPEEIQKMLDIGCELGNHTTSHANLANLGTEGIQEEVGGTNSRIRDIVGQGASVLRPPYGITSDTMKSACGMPIIQWSVDTMDWKTRNAQATIDNVLSHACDGDVVLMHDIHSESIDAALKLIPELVRRGYQLVTVSELAQARGITLQNGSVYFSFYP